MSSLQTVSCQSVILREVHNPGEWHQCHLHVIYLDKLQKLQFQKPPLSILLQFVTLQESKYLKYEELGWGWLLFCVDCENFGH